MHGRAVVPVRGLGRSAVCCGRAPSVACALATGENLTGDTLVVLRCEVPKYYSPDLVCAGAVSSC